jgi:hypothetical protein
MFAWFSTVHKSAGTVHWKRSYLPYLRFLLNDSQLVIQRYIIMQLMAASQPTDEKAMEIVGYLFYYILSLLIPWVLVVTCSVQGCSKKRQHFQKFIFQVLLNIWRRAICRLKWEISKLFSHLTSTRCERHVWRGSVKSIIQLFPHST